MITIQTITLADFDGGGKAYVVCEDNDINQAYEQFDTLAEAEDLVKEMETLIEVADINSDGIISECEKLGITHIELLDEGHSDGDTNNPNSRVRFYLVGCVRVADTNGDPIWEEDDFATFAELIKACEVDL